MVQERETEAIVKLMFHTHKVKPTQIARRLGLSRQAVSYHLSDKTKRHRSVMPAETRDALRGAALRRYHTKKALEVLE